ncbi:uncharacterized protein LOC125804921 [Astyanax mexicanus]|uniref:uncharacterized protein LOC125804921 n=1 Tax=Astyanax mexicanus TaxID=7994 RepID=UPI0020CAC4FD|nr:uncharacterized protein LOC125804921 [Astyanax mexicanus]XP_049340757.1 uncharacterized protein LOC125804921 [Astyanax mexicanus]XP_049340758.1 uncharacterized protein LOC125804921 [Astyanax mexicanus]
MDNELQRLREQVEQLQTENERLSVSQNGGTGDNSRGVHVQPARREQAFYLPRERKCPKFSGSTATGALSVEEWVEEVQSCTRSRCISDLDKALFLYDHLEGGARNEIKYRSAMVREDPREIISVLKEVYGCAKSYVYWQQRFFDRKQRDGESLFDFSHALMELMDRVKQCKRDAIVNPDGVLRDQFCENVRDSALRRELKRLVRTDEGVTLLDVRREAIRWIEEGQPGRDRGQRLIGYNSEIASQCEATVVQPAGLAELRDLVLKQQAQLDMLVRRLGPVNSNFPTSSVPRASRFKRTPDGQPICIKCNNPGHIARYCQAAPPTRDNGPVHQVRSHSSSPSEN